MRRDASLGPYINAKTTAGGITHWITSQLVNSGQMQRTGRRRGKTIYRESSQKRYHTRSAKEGQLSVIKPYLRFSNKPDFVLLAIQLGLYHVLFSKSVVAD